MTQYPMKNLLKNNPLITVWQWQSSTQPMIAVIEKSHFFFDQHQQK